MRGTSWALGIAAGMMALGALGLGSERVAVAADHDATRRGCSEATLKGAYGIQMQGTRPSAPGGRSNQ